MKENGLLHDMGMSSFLEKTQWAKHAEGVGAEASQVSEESRRQKGQIEALASEGANLRSIIEALQHERTQLKVTIRSLEANISEVKLQISQRINREGELDQRCHELERQLDEVRREKARLDETVSGQHVKIAGMQPLVLQLQEQKGSGAALLQKLETARLEITRCYQEKADFDQTVSTLHVEADSSGGSGGSGGPSDEGSEEPVVGSADLPSHGSARHRLGDCKPCAFYQQGLCRNDVQCVFCHLCEPGEKKRRRKEWLDFKRVGRKAKPEAPR